MIPVQKKISVIMPSYLTKYEGSAKNRIEKFNRAVKSFLNSVYYNKELIIVSDGCEKTIEAYEKLYSKKQEIILKKIDKQPLFSGNVRHEGIKAATGDYICYLDTDDYFALSHLAVIMNEFNNNEELDWLYYNDWYCIATNRSIVSETNPYHYGEIGTSSIAHRKNIDATWENCDGYGHDFVFIQKLLKASKKYKKIYGCGYYVAHTRNKYDF